MPAEARRLLLVALEIHTSPLEARMTRRLISVLASALLLISGGARAQTPPANTGTTGPVDLGWQVSTNGGTTWFSALKVINPSFPLSGFIPPNWEPNTVDYSWISKTTTGSGGGGNYLFRTFFSLTGFDPSSAVLSFRLRGGQPADHWPVQPERRRIHRYVWTPGPLPFHRDADD